MSHDTYQSHIKTKRAEVIGFRNELISRFTNPLAKMKAKEREARQLKHLASLKEASISQEKVITSKAQQAQSKSSIPELSVEHNLKSKPLIDLYP